MEIAVVSVTAIGALTCTFANTMDPARYDDVTFKSFMVCCVIALCYVIIRQHMERQKERSFYEQKLEKIVEGKNEKLLEAQKQSKIEADQREVMLINHITTSNEKMNGLEAGLKKFNDSVDKLNGYFDKFVFDSAGEIFHAGLSRYKVPENKDKTH